MSSTASTFLIVLNSINKAEKNRARQTQSANGGREEKSVFGGKTVDSHGVRDRQLQENLGLLKALRCVCVCVCMTDKHKHPELNERPEQKPAGSNPYLLLFFGKTFT